ncbi:hypothetical protein [Streptomyces halobius]|uniref:Resolvase-like protein n=1 Tax=Streptomyces halobius TaxID=2879846 RepID=A0ABY4M3K2_9ACTN|nr:hypothetical protein [Streptomyces halobius]UQA92346.1 hypothetical protein K9S39_11290 [Streptomyces halobius]
MTDRLYSRHSSDKQTNSCELHALDGLLKPGTPKYVTGHFVPRLRDRSGRDPRAAR